MKTQKAAPINVQPISICIFMRNIVKMGKNYYMCNIKILTKQTTKETRKKILIPILLPHFQQNASAQQTQK